MSGFKHHRDKQHRYNIYENYIEEVEKKSFYETLRNTLFYIALILTLSITSFISFDIYQENVHHTSKVLLVNDNQQNQVKNEITDFELTQVISNSIINQIDIDNSFNEINQYQLKLIVQNVMKKVKNSSKHIIYRGKD